ncbi:MAG TPA: M15 family metallopeptidase [Steroidobacteraceae bacterium]|nr:M15 family metallopeptidase [Steroidobacteraceae bacterium]
MDRRAASLVPALTPRQLTGRDSQHVQEVTAPACVLHPCVVPALHDMCAAAADDGLTLLPVSSFRDFERQRTLWNGKFLGERPVQDAEGRPVDMRALDAAERVRAILVWSALPGASRHHWGSDLDVVDGQALAGGYRPRLTREEFLPGGPFGRLAAWLDARCGEFGFFRPYDAWRGGVQPEPWHLSYADLAVPALAALDADVLREALEGADIQGKAQVLAQLPDLHQRYVRGVAEPAGFSRAASFS